MKKQNDADEMLEAMCEMDLSNPNSALAALAAIATMKQEPIQQESKDLLCIFIKEIERTLSYRDVFDRLSDNAKFVLARLLAEWGPD